MMRGKKNKKGLVLLSGGQDSATCLAIALKECKEVEAIFFEYGQRHIIEKEKSVELSKIANIPLHIQDVTFIASLSENALTNKETKIEQKPGELPNTFVPGRNLFFLSIAAVVARVKKCDVIYTGVCQADYSGYPDCREEFIRALEKTVNLALEENIKIETPLMNLTKAQTVQLMKKLGRLRWYAHTHTCYEGESPACGACPACILRKKGFKEAGLEDLIPYKK